MKSLILMISLLCSFIGHSQYIAVRARYTETRLVANPGLPPDRENRLVLSFFTIDAGGNYIPTTLTDYPIYIYKEGFQYGSMMGGILDSTGNNYPGYSWTAPKAVAYFNSYFPNYIDCDPNAATAYTANGYELDCGFVRVSHCEGDPTLYNESFYAPNICLPYYFVGEHPYASVPGNMNFSWPIAPGPPYNWYSFTCSGSTQQVIIRGVLGQDTASPFVLPVRFAFEKSTIDENCRPFIKWSNLTESGISHYEVQRSLDGNTFSTVAQLNPILGTGGRADYTFTDTTLNASPTIYYRIKAVETSGTHFFSITMRLASCAIITIPKLSIFPNPSQDARFVLQATELPPGKYDILLLSVAGQLQKVSAVDHSGGTLYKLFDLHWLQPGTYTVVLRSAEYQITRKILILD